MESLLLRGLESTLRYWLKSFSREQFRLRGRSIHLYDLDLDGNALHASLGLPPTLRITEARVGTLEIRIASITNVYREPIVVEIDALDLVISEKLLDDLGYIPGTLPSNSSGDGAGYGYSDKLADGMTVRVGKVHVMLETKGGTSSKGTATRSPEVASITMRNLELYTTNERWQVVPLNQARDFSLNRGAIYVFKKVVWESLSVDLLPPNDEYLRGRSRENAGWDHGGERTWRGEGLLEKVSGSANITVQRTESYQPFGLEVQIHVPEILCPKLSEPGLQALLRFITGITVCVNREDANVRSFQSADEAGRTVIGLRVDYIFLSVKDADFQLEFLMKYLHYVRASVVDGNCLKTMTQFMVNSFFLSDTSTQPSCTLIQPSTRTGEANIKTPVPAFASEKLWPRIHPYESWMVSRTETAPMLCMYSSLITPSPAAPTLASQVVFQCQPLKIALQEATCLRIAVLVAECVVLESAVVLPDQSLHAVYFTLKEFDLTVPINGALMGEALQEGPFTGVRLHVDGFMMAKSPFLNFRLLELDKDPACASMWKGKPVESSHQRWAVRASHAAIALETGERSDDAAQHPDWSAGLWHCVEMSDLCVEAAMLSADGQPMVTFFPSGGIVRLGLSCKRCVANMAEEQYLFLMRVYRLAGNAVDALYEMSKSMAQKEIQMNTQKRETMLDMVPADSSVVISLSMLELRLLQSKPGSPPPPLAKLLSWEIILSVTHKSLAGAAMVNSKLLWQDFRVECAQPAAAAAVRTEIPAILHTSEKRSTNLPLRDSLSSSSESSMSSSASSSRMSSMERQPSSHAVERERVQKEEENIPAGAAPPPTMYTVIWTGKERGSMAPVGRDGDGYSLPHTPFLDVNVETLIPYGSQEMDAGRKLQVVAKLGGVRLGGSMCQSESLLYSYGVFGPGGVPGKNLKKAIEILSHGPLATLLRPLPDAAKRDPEMHAGDEKLWDVNVFDVVDLDIQLLDWLFALEGVEVVPESTRDASKQGYPISVNDSCWYTTFRCLKLVGRGMKAAMRETEAREDTRKLSHPVQNLTVRIEGLQAVKHHHPLSLASQARNDSTDSHGGDPHQLGTNGAGTEIGDEPKRKIRRLADTLPNVTTTSGFDLEVRLVERGHGVDTNLGMGDWVVESFRAGVQEPVEIGGTRREVEDLVEVCKAEIKAASRIATAAVKLFQIEPVVPESAIEHLSDLGSGRLESMVPPEQSKAAPSANPPMSRARTTKEKDLAELEAAILTSQALCSKISSHMGWIKEEKSFFCCNTTVRDNAPVSELRGLQKQLASMKALLASLRNETNS